MDDRCKREARLVKTLKVFENLDDEDIQEMLTQPEPVIRLICYRPGEKIITEKRFDRKIFLIIRGKVQVTKDVIRGHYKESQLIKVVEGSGHFLGEVTALTGKPRTATVAAVEETICLVIDIDMLRRTSSTLLVRVRNQFYPRLFELLCRRLEETDEGFVNLKQQKDDLEHKFAELRREKMDLRTNYEQQLAQKRMEVRKLEEKVRELKQTLREAVG